MLVAAKIQDGIVYSPYPSFDMPYCSLYSFFEEKIRVYADKVAIVDGEVKLTHAQLHERLKRFLTGFKKHGVQPGDRVMVNTENSYYILMASYALMFHGAVVVFPGAKRTANELSYQIRETNTKVVITDSLHLDITTDALTSVSHNVEIFTLTPIPGFVSLSAFELMSETPFEESATGETMNVLTMIGYTSGTTGPTKGVQFSQYNLLAGVLGTMNTGFVEENDAPIIINSLIFCGTVRHTLIYLGYGTPVVIAKSDSTPWDLANIIRRNQVSHIFGTTCRLERMTRALHAADVLLPSVRKISYSGHPLSAETVEAMHTMFSLSSLRNCYGLTEAGGRVAITPSNEIVFNSVGFPGSMVQLKVRDCDSGKRLGANEIGEICIKTPSLMIGYLNKPKETEEVISSDGWLRSGDLGYYDNNGRFYYVDRIKDVIKCHTFYVSPTELEDILLTHEAVQEACVVGVPNPIRGDDTTAFVVLYDSYIPSNNLADTLKILVEEQTPKHKHLYGGIIFVDAIPRNDNGKPMKRLLKCCAETARGSNSIKVSVDMTPA